MNTLSRVSLLVVSSLIAGVTMFTPALARDGDDDRCAGSRDVKLVNGKIHTLDARNSIVSSVTIKNGKFAVVGDDGHSDGGPCMQVINLGGRTAVPGLVDNHNHFLLLGLRPGHDTRLETAASIADVQAAIRARTKTVKPGQWITAMGGWTPGQFAENRLPTLAELDAAAPNNPVLVFNSFFGPATTNTPGKTFFSGKGVTVDGAGNIAADGASIAALNALRAYSDLRRQEAGNARRHGLFGERRRDHQCRHGRLRPSGNVPILIIPRSSTPWRVGTPSPPTIHSWRFMMKARSRYACASSS